MKLLRMAKKTATAYDISCPHCGESISVPVSGSLFWTVEELRSHIGKVLCECDEMVKLPKV